MLKTYPLPEWTPDLANNVLTIAQNVRAIANGYAPVKSLQGVTATFGAQLTGGGAFIASDGTSVLLAATSGDVFKYSGSGFSVAVGMASTQRTRFAQFGDNVLIAGGGQIGYYNLITAANGGVLTAPDSIDIAQVRDFVMAITTDNKVQWSQFNDALTWTTGTNQADFQPILSGSGVRLVGGEYGILLRDNGITRISYVGAVGDIIFQFDEISAEVGCMAAGSVCNVGRLIFFLSERGFMMCDGNDVTPIADEKFNRWFFDRFSRADIANIWAAIDPRNSLVLWAMPGNPGTIIAYNWVLKRATTLSVNVTGMFTGYTSAITLDGLDAVYPSGLDSIPVSLDDPSLQGGNPILLIADSSNIFSALTGDNLEATFRLENIEPTPGRRSRIRSLRLISDTTNASAVLNSRMREGDAEHNVSAVAMRTNGKLPVRANGRYNNLTVTIPAAARWTNIQGCELEFEAGDGR